MKDFQGYLKSNVVVEPLINQWYAWSYLIPPATAARYLTHSQIPVMESFVSAPQVHATALKDPAMRGGPFIHHDASRVPEIQTLLEQTQQEQAKLLLLSEAIATLETLLADHPPGASLEPLYAQLPPALRGFVELVYDPQHRASMRLMEGLLYRSDYYDPSRQRVALQLGNTDERAFVLSTPRLPEAASLQIPRPFCDRTWDQLFTMRHTPQSVGQMAAALGLDKSQTGRFANLFTTTPPRDRSPYDGNGVRIRYFGHACVLIETQDVSVLVDPLVSYDHPRGMARYSYADLPDTIDYALITHNHQDHVMLETLLQIRHKIRHLVVPQSQKGSLIDPSLKLILQQIGFHPVMTLDELETIPLPDGEIISLPVLGEHGDLNIATKTAYWIQLKGRTVLCAADSNNLDPQLYQHLHHLFGSLDVLFIGMECDGAPYTWAYGPLLTQSVPHHLAQSRRLDGSNADRAITLVQQLQPQQVYVYAMGQEPWLTFITSISYTNDSAPIQESNRLVAHCRQIGLESDRLLSRKEIELAAQETTTWTQRRIPVEVQSAVDSPKSGNDINQEPTTNNQPPITNNQQSKIQNSKFNRFLQTLNRLDIRLWLDGDTLRCNAPKGTMTPDIKQQLKQYKPDIIAVLKGESVEAATQEDWEQDRVLPKEIRPEGDLQEGLPSRILLTGATGFLGAFLLEALLRQTQAEIVCLVRAETESGGWQRLINTLKSYGIWQEDFRSRITVQPGDLAKPDLGLSAQAFQTLAESVDVIYHNGAWVHHVSPYSLLRTTNVLGTQQVIRLACQHHPKPLHFTSTLSVLPPMPPGDQVKMQEDDPLDRYPVPTGGYNRTKWVAEQLVTQASDRTLPVTIYRPGPISGHSQTGAFNANDFLYRLMQGYIQLGSAPQGAMPLDILPVDYVSRAIVHLSQQPQSLGKVFHLIHPEPASSDGLFAACRTAGYPIQRVSYEQWHGQLRAIAQGQTNHPLYPLVSLFSSRNDEEVVQASDDKPHEVPFDCQNAQSGLAEAPFSCPALDESLFATYLKALKNSGALKSPPVSASY
ncbi:thioester reductase domain-containing protein [Oscillatoria sp. CS-180]|uniref:thioester reductase domain-containing protein n=1 Tax=Oscillatoria sp. CS-180 TaxID=3021720 RepID=UPI00232EDC5E|nr:thioester reductase domain-containing protein [Oscillatoria sp. CS-180]MDB9524608.1 thioester reductase domain-containing protein [Oscillatoria sp. CS-180]